jgi:hypothetical protein
MKRRTHAGAAALGVHPLNLLIYLAHLGAPLEQVWPEIDEEWIDAVRGLDWRKFRQPSDEGRVRGLEDHAGGKLVNVPTISEGAAQVVGKLWRKRYWGNNAVSWDTLRNHFCRHVRDLEEAVRELIVSGYLVPEGAKGPYSLNSARKGEIERIARDRVLAEG